MAQDPVRQVGITDPHGEVKIAPGVEIIDMVKPLRDLQVTLPALGTRDP